MALSKKWKTALLAILLVIAIGGVFCGAGGYLLWKWMQSSACEVYGGPLPANVTSIAGMSFGKDRIGLYQENSSSLLMVIVHSSPSKKEDVPLSEEDIQVSLTDFGESIQLTSALEGIQNAYPSTIPFGEDVLHTIRFFHPQGEPMELGILNLEKSRMLFIAIGYAAPEHIALFLKGMPVLKHDGRLLSKNGKSAVDVGASGLDEQKEVKWREIPD